METLVELDKQLMVILNSIHSPFWDSVMWIVSDRLTWIPLYLVIIFFFFYKKDWKGALTVTIAVILLVIIADKISVVGFKRTICRLRPSHEPDLAGLLHHINDYKGGLYGFVSSHATNMFAIATFTSLHFKRNWITISMVLWAIVVSYSRIYLGVHYPGDILGGSILGILCGIMFYQICKKISYYKKTYC